VFVARRADTGARYAIKTLKRTADEAFVERFRREGEAQAKVDRHPNVVRVHSMGEAQGRLYLVLELVEGEDLERRLRRGLPPVWGTAVDDAHQFDRVDPKVTNPGRGWVMVRADTLTPAALAAALARGDFYASTGVALRDVRRDGARLTVAIDAEPGVEYTTEFVGTRRGGAAGEVLATVRGRRATYRLRGDELYVRARVTSSRLKPNGYAPGERERAWTEPVIGKR
jgi:hypothetical protein